MTDEVAGARQRTARLLAREQPLTGVVLFRRRPTTIPASTRRTSAGCPAWSSTCDRAPSGTACSCSTRGMRASRTPCARPTRGSWPWWGRPPPMRLLARHGYARERGQLPHVDARDRGGAERGRRRGDGGLPPARQPVHLDASARPPHRRRQGDGLLPDQPRRRSRPGTRRRSTGIERVAILDWDVHHGNGTQDIHWQDPSVLFVSLHQWPLYPGDRLARRGRRTATGREPRSICRCRPARVTPSTWRRSTASCCRSSRRSARGCCSSRPARTDTPPTRCPSSGSRSRASTRWPSAPPRWRDGWASGSSPSTRAATTSRRYPRSIARSSPGWAASTCRSTTCTCRSTRRRRRTGRSGCARCSTCSAPTIPLLA